MAAGELRELLWRRRAHDLEDTGARAVLEWLIPGTVWATDFTRLDPDLTSQCSSSEGLALVVRDLAAKRVLAVVPAHSENAEVVTRTLSRLIALHGAPLVLKSDNGSGYVAEGTAALCRQHGILTLFSPPGCPEYNGSVEASNAWLKRDLGHLVRRQDEGCELADLLEAARTLRNRTGRPWGASRPTPDEVWATRPALCAGTRRALRRQVATECAEEHARLRGVAREAALSHKEEAAIRREVLRRVLVGRGYLVIRRRGISL